MSHGCQVGARHDADPRWYSTTGSFREVAGKKADLDVGSVPAHHDERNGTEADHLSGKSIKKIQNSHGLCSRFHTLCRLG